jgi:ribosomal protein S18 acetylase RimI-like enzyme
MITFHNVTLQEIPTIKQLHLKTSLATYCDFLSQEIIHKMGVTEEDLLNEAKNSAIYFQVAKNDLGEIVGFIEAERKNTDEVHIIRIYVHPDFQGKGIGKKLLFKAISRFKNTKKITLELHEKNIKAKNFYLSQGFKIIGKKQMIFY